MDVDGIPRSSGEGGIDESAPFTATGDPGRPGFPAVRHEELPWEGDTASIPRSRRGRFGPAYRATITPKIASLPELPVTTATAAAAEEAARAVTRFDAELGAELAPFSTILLRSESAASSQIENLTASAKSIGLAELDETNRPNATLIVANVRAMRAAIALSEQLDASAIIEMHRQLLGPTRPEMVGAWRAQQVWIGGSRWGPHDASHVAPHHDRVDAAMNDLIRFMRRDDLPTLIQIATAHAQFETIHPFPDGNGRTGRALIHSMLRAKEVTRTVTVPVSAGLLADTAGYFDALDAYRRGELDPIVAALTDASFAAIDNGQRLRSDLIAVRAGWQERVRARRDAVIWRIADHLIAQPVVNARVLRTTLGASAPAIQGALGRLADAGVVSNLTGKSRNRVWVADEVIAALDAFAERAGRRG